MKKSLALWSFTAVVLTVLMLGICADVRGGDIFDLFGPANRNHYFNSLRPYFPGAKALGSEEMRITFMGTSCIPRISQAAVSAFVELGNGDTFLFDAGAGVMPKYFAMGIRLNKMDRIFLAHLHADHMGDLPYIYGFGPSYGRFWPLYIWGPSRSEFIYKDPNGNYPFGETPLADGTADLTDALSKLSVWHNQSQSFLPTGYSDYIVPPWGDANKTDAYDIVTHELPWRNTGFVDGNGNHVPGPGPGIEATNDNIAYNNYNGVKITHFPAVHTRQGSVSYKLEWNGLSMIYSGDTLPSQYVISQALSGVDVLIHELVVPATVWNEKMGLPPEDLQWTQEIQDSSHTPQKALGYILSQIKQLGKAPRLAVGTHFQAEDDTIKPALADIRRWYKKGDVVIANDLMVVTVSKEKIDVQRAVVSNYAWPQATTSPYTTPNPPKYWTWVDPTDHQKGVTGNPTAQLDPYAIENYVIPSDVYNAR